MCIYKYVGNYVFFFFQSFFFLFFFFLSTVHGAHGHETVLVEARTAQIPQYVSIVLFTVEIIFNEPIIHVYGVSKVNVHSFRSAAGLSVRATRRRRVHVKLRRDNTTEADVFLCSRAGIIIYNTMYNNIYHHVEYGCDRCGVEKRKK